MDALIAATALSRNAILVTRNLREFGRVQGLKVVDWYERRKFNPALVPARRARAPRVNAEKPAEYV